MKKKMVILTIAVVLLFAVWQISWGRIKGTPLSATDTSFPKAERNITYNIDITLNPDQGSIYGTETVLWTNPGSTNVDEVYFYLYPNAFTRESSFVSETDGQASLGDSGMQILSLLVNGQKQRFVFVQPDDNNTDDTTVGYIQLENTLLPGETVELFFEFEVRLPPIIARMGYHKDFFLLAQWYPKIAAYETEGIRDRTASGWNVHQYHAWGEFYGNFADFNVSINVPTDYLVVGSGTLIDQKEGKLNTYLYKSSPVHTFCWVADRNAIYRNQEMVFGDNRVRTHLLTQPALITHVDDYFDAVETAVKFYSEWIAPYPYDDLTIVIPEKGASEAGGMEYPTLVVAADAGSVGFNNNLLRTLVHELAHQWFYGVVASNETEEAWLDEGFAWYMTDKAMQQAFGRKALVGEIRTQHPLTLESWEFPTFDDYANTVATRAKQVLNDIERQIGEEKMKEFMREYYDSFKFGHPSTKNVQTILERVTNRSWEKYFDTHVYGPGN